MMSPQEIAVRRPVWAALSELFLDTALDAGDLERLGDIVASSPYSLPELDQIVFRELVPALWKNLAVPAGEWERFDQAGLEASIVRRRGRRVRWPSWLLPRGAVREPWSAVRERVRLARCASVG